MVYSEGISRPEYAQRFGELYGREPTWQNFSYGKVHNLSEIVEFLVMLTKGAITKDQESNPGEHLLLKNRPLCEWKAVEWKGFRSRLNTIQMSLLRCDASASIDDIYRGDSENSAIDESRSQNKWFTTRLIRVLDLLTLHETLAPFRQVLENMSTVSGDEALLPMSLPKELAEQFIETIDIIDGGSEEQTRLLQKAFCSLLKNERTNTFHSPATMRRIFDDPTRNYSFTRLFNRVDKLIRQWVSIVFKEPIAIDTDVSNAARAPNSTGAVESENEGAQARALKRLQRSRARLKDRVTDPLAEAVFVANRARGNRKRKQRNHIPYDDDDDDDEDEEEQEEESGGEDGSVEGRSFTNNAEVNKHGRHRTAPGARGRMLDKKKSATRLGFTQSDNEEIDDPEDEVLPTVRRRIQVTELSSPTKKIKKSQVKMYEGRRNWSDSEKKAVIDGVIRWGVGNWSQIKTNDAVILGNRTSGQIKDCYRTMKKRGELDHLEEAWPESNNISRIEEDEKDKEKDDDETVVHMNDEQIQQ